MTNERARERAGQREKANLHKDREWDKTTYIEKNKRFTKE